MIVVDSSAVVEWLLRSSKGMAIDRRLFDAGESLHAPHLLDLEVCSALRRSVFEEALRTVRAEEAILDFKALSVTRYSHRLFLSRVWQLRHAITSYDASYVALAEALDAPLVTCDRKLASAPGLEIHIELY